MASHSTTKTVSSAVEAPPAQTLDIVSIGECLVELNRRDDGTFAPTYAGDAFNALFYASRLGARAGFVSAVGDDLFTTMIVEGIEREKIDTSRLLRLEGRRNGLYFIELDARGEYTFHFWRADSAATETLLHHNLGRLARYLAGARYVLVTGVTLAVMKAPERLVALLGEISSRTRIVLDTNYRARLWTSPGAYRERLESILPFVDIFLPTRDDLIAAYDGADPVDTLLGDRSTRTIVMKCGAEGCAIVRDGVIEMHRPPEPIEVIDATGAGDAFNGGFLAGLSRGLDVAAACELGQRTAARALRVRGALDHRFGE